MIIDNRTQKRTITIVLETRIGNEDPFVIDNFVHDLLPDLKVLLSQRPVSKQINILCEIK